MAQVNERPTWHLREFDKPLVVASHFGFLPIDAPKVTDKDVEMVKDCGTHPHYSAADKVAFLRHYQEKNLCALPHPLGVAYKKGRAHHLELVGFPAGLAEAILIRTSLSILAETGHKSMLVDINCIGDKDSIAAYERELANFLRKSGDRLTAELKKELRRDVFEFVRHPSPELVELRQSAPTSIAFLSSASRSYFKEVLEYIEALDVEFRLSPELIGDKNYCSHTIFNIKEVDGDKETVLAVGYSYHRLGRRVGLKKDTLLAGASIFSEPKSESARGRKPMGEAKRIYKELPKPKFYLVQLGREAKMKTLSTLELLRRERIAVHHVLGKDKLTAQLSAAENLRVPYLLIIGQKEALEDTVTIRNTVTRAQDTIPVSILASFLKNIAL